MRFDNSSMDTRELLALINNIFPIDGATNIEFIPKGEEGYCYSIEAKGKRTYFVKALPIQMNLEEGLKTIHCLHNDYGKKYVLPPLKTRIGKLSAVFGQYQISIFPFIQGETLYENERTITDSKDLASIMADFHSLDPSSFDYLPREKFDNPFEKSILKLLDLAENGGPFTTKYKENAKVLLLKEKDDIHTTLQYMKTMQKQLKALPYQSAITHGDPNYANVMRDLQGNLHLVDLVWIGIGPVERDLKAYAEDELFSEFLSVYLKKRPKTKLYVEMFEYYLYRWSLQEISDFGERIFFGTSGELESDAWTELQPYLPIPHQEIKRNLSRIGESIKDVVSKTLI